jgi:molybdenum cofactor cytidylyltransferase
MSSTFRTFGLIPAAGKSRRMGQVKLALPLGERTVLQRVVAAVRQAGVEPILVVLGPHVAHLAEPAREAGAAVLVLHEETPDMRATVEQGLTWLEQHVQPGLDDGWLLLPADHPTLDPEVVRRLLEAKEASPRHSLLVPTWQGRRGHPAWIGWGHVPGIRALDAGLGLNMYLRRHAEETLEVPVETASILLDLDTPEDYQRLLKESGERGASG